jgi:hypothetical protein
VKEISVKGDKIFIALTYSPRGSTLKRKFGNLPVRYLRTKLEKEEEFKILEKVVRKYKFNLLEEQLDDVRNETTRLETGKRKYILESPSLDDDDDDQMLGEENDKLLHQLMAAAQSSLSSSTSMASKSTPPPPPPL